MTKTQWVTCRNYCAVFGLFGLTLFLAGCLPAQRKPAAKQAPARISLLPLFIKELDAHDAHVVPMLFDSTQPHMLVRVSINGAKPLYFIVDTGSPNSINMEPWAAKALGLKQTPVDKEDYFSNSNKPVFSAALRSVDLMGKNGNVAYHTKCKTGIIVDTEVLKFRKGNRIAGFVGNELLSDLTVQFDFLAKTMTVYPKRHLPFRPSKNANVVLLAPAASGSFHRNVSINIPGTGKVPVLLDTGSDGGLSLLPQAAVKAKNILISRDMEGLVGVGGVVHKAVPVLFPDVGIGKWNEPNVVASVSRTETEQVLGLGFLSRFRVTLDWRYNEMILERAANYADLIKVKGDVEFKVFLNNGQMVAGDVSDAQTGDNSVHPDDQILAVDGVPTKGKTAEAMQGLVDGPAGTKVTLRLQRKNNPPFEISLSRISSFESPETPVRIGFNSGVEKNGLFLKSLNVSVILPNSPAERAGLKEGDVIVAVNKLKVAGKTLERVNKEISNPDAKQVTFTVRHQGSDAPVTVVLKTGGAILRDLLRP